MMQRGYADLFVLPHLQSLTPILLIPFLYPNDTDLATMKTEFVDSVFSFCWDFTPFETPGTFENPNGFFPEFIG